MIIFHFYFYNLSQKVKTTKKISLCHPTTPDKMNTLLDNTKANWKYRKNRAIFREYSESELMH